MSRSVLAAQELGAVEEPLERSPGGEGGVVDGEEVDVRLDMKRWQVVLSVRSSLGERRTK